MPSISIIGFFLLMSCSVRGVEEDFIVWGPVKLSRSSAEDNVRLIHEFIQSIYYAGVGEGTPRGSDGVVAEVVKMPAEQFQELWKDVALSLQELAHMAQNVPALLFPVGAALYHWFFFKWKGAVMLPQVDDRSLEAACELLRLSLNAEPVCTEGLATPVTRERLELFLQKGCDYRWTHMIMLEIELGRELALRRNAGARASDLLVRAQDHLTQLLQQPYFANRKWRTPYDMNMNEELFPSPGPVWSRDLMPLVSFLEEHYPTFRAELDTILTEPGLFDLLHQLERNAEGQDHARQEDWLIIELADTREEEPWKQKICAFLPRTCELLRRRAEFQCDHAAAFINRLRPGAWIKPHMGNPPRLVAHLGLIVPPTEPVDLYVGDASLKWETGKAHVIDDTYIHSVKHLGDILPVSAQTPKERERYILHMLICHPCEPSQRQHYEGLNIKC